MKVFATQERYGERQVGMGWLLAGVVRTRILEIKGNFDGVLVGGRKLLQREELGDWWRMLWWENNLAVVSYRGWDWALCWACARFEFVSGVLDKEVINAS